MNLLIKAFLIRSSKEQGFAIPIVIALGLIMILIGMVSIVKSNEEDLTAIGQRGTQRALTAAEAGVAYYRDLINKNRAIAVYSACKDEDKNKDGKLTWDNSQNKWTCSNNGTTVSWANNTNIPNINFYNSCSSAGFTTDNGFGANAVQNATVNIGWQDVNNNPDLGQYRLVSYSYADNAGTLIIEGRDRNSDNDASVTRLRVEFPIQPGIPRPPGASQDAITNNLNNLAPALWIGSDNNSITLNSDNDNLEVVNSNILVSKLDCQLSSGTKDIAEALGNVSAEAQNLPSIPIPLGQIYGISNNSIIKNIPLPRSADDWVLGGDGKSKIYQYRIENELNFNNEDLIITVGDNEKVVLYVQDDITFNGKVKVNCIDVDNDNVCEDTNTSNRLEIYSDREIDIEFKGSGKIKIKAFIHAPNATVKVSGTPTVEITGAVWVKEWDNQTNAKVKITPDTLADTTLNERYYHYTSVRQSLDNNNLVIKPIIYPPSRWETVEAE
ncbi:hypothetical protein IQ238_28565 [Pleurocapsales cyanobacterium LEGE 06147]|nr:hypothetical protein [Pleurocapsales cyanobacterium LEGE 06147]